MKPLIVPPAAQRDEESIQMISAWIAENGLHCALNIGMWQENDHPEPPAWGILLADVIRHISHALEDEYGLPASETTSQILASINDELEEPTSDMDGEFAPGHT